MSLKSPRCPVCSCTAWAGSHKVTVAQSMHLILQMLIDEADAMSAVSATSWAAFPLTQPLSIPKIQTHRSGEGDVPIHTCVSIHLSYNIFKFKALPIGSLGVSAFPVQAYSSLWILFVIALVWIQPVNICYSIQLLFIPCLYSVK